MLSVSLFKKYITFINVMQGKNFITSILKQCLFYIVFITAVVVSLLLNVVNIKNYLFSEKNIIKPYLTNIIFNTWTRTFLDKSTFVTTQFYCKL